MSNIAIFGGSFNPIGIHHIDIANHVLLNLKFIDYIWLMPTYKHTFGKDKNYIFDRSMLIKKIETDKIKCSDFEIENKIMGGTYETVSLLKKKFPNDIFYWIIGSDCANEIEKWKNYEKLINEINFIVVSRDKTESREDSILKRDGNIFVDKIEKTSYSSTEIRKRLANKESITDLIPKEIEQEIIKQFGDKK